MSVIQVGHRTLKRGGGDSKVMGASSLPLQSMMLFRDHCGASGPARCLDAWMPALPPG